MRNFVPRFILEQFAGGSTRAIPAGVLFVDISASPPDLFQHRNDGVRY